jgi:hypothetical protein
MQPRNSIDEIIKAMAKRFDQDDDRLVETTHLRYWLENAVEALVACEAVQEAREQQMDVLQEQVNDLNQQVLNLVADQAVLSRQLAVATEVQHVDFDITMQWDPDLADRCRHHADKPPKLVKTTEGKQDSCGADSTYVTTTPTSKPKQVKPTKHKVSRKDKAK